MADDEPWMKTPIIRPLVPAMPAREPEPPVDEWGIPAPSSDQTPRQLDAPSVEFHPFAAPKPGALGRVGQAAAEGWGGGQVASPNLIMAPVYNTLMGGLGAVFRGGQQFVQEAINPILPGLGRDIAALPEAFPTGTEFKPDVPQPGVTRPQFLPGESNPVLPRGKPQPPPGAPPGPAQTAEVYPKPPDLDPRGVPIMDFTPPRNTMMTDVERPLMPVEPTPAQQAGTQTTGLENLGAAGKAIGDNLRDMLWDKLQKGDTTELGRPSQILTDAKAAMDQGSIKSRTDFDAWAQQWAAQRRTGQATPEPTSAQPAPTGEAQPRSAGAAATPAGLAKMDLDETKAARTTAEWQELLQPAAKGDTTEHVLGVKPTKAEIEQSAPVSTESKLLRQEFREPYSEDEAAKMETIRTKLEDTAGTATVVNSMERARDAVAAKQRDAIWANKGEADTAPLYKYQSDMLASEDGARPLVRNVVDRVVKELTDADGKPIADPQRLYGVRKHIDDLIAEQGASGKPANERAMAQLLGMKKVLDEQVIEPAAPGFMKYLSDYHEASKPIDVMKYLQEKVPGLMTGPNRNITFSKFDKFMKDLAIERAQKNYGGAEAMDDGTRQTLMGIWRHLQRSASDQELAKVNGSDTTQRMMELLRSGAVRAAVHTGVGYVTGGLGNAFVPMLGEQFQRSRQMKKVQQHLNPDLSQYPTTPQNGLGP